MIPRLALEQLRDWKSRRNRLPLIITGARHVGKTTLVQEFSTQFEHFLAFDLETIADQSIFSRCIGMDNFIQVLFLERELPYHTHDTLLFIDEIQEHPDTLAVLPKLIENNPQLHIIAAGSLVDHALVTHPEIPVDQIEFLALHPLSFHEYLLGKGRMSILAAYLDTPIPDYAHRSLMEVFNEYVTIGGMPAVVKSFLEDRDYTLLRQIYESVLTSYRDDILKYARSTTVLQTIQHIMRSVPFLANDRIKFERFGNTMYKSRESSKALRSLEIAHIIQLIYPTTMVSAPCVTDRKRSPRLQFLDTGLVNYSTVTQKSLLGLTDLASVFNGKVIKHIATQELVSLSNSRTYTPQFWVRKATASLSTVDLVLAYEDRLIPIVVKSGKPGRLRSLHQFIDQCPHQFAIRIYSGSFLVEPARTIKGKSFTLLSLPYYLVGRIPQYIRQFAEQP